MRIQLEQNLDSFVNACRWLIAEQAHPDGVEFLRAGAAGSTDDLFSVTESAITPPPSASSFKVPRGYSDLVRSVYYHTAPEALPTLYRLLWRILHGEPKLLEIVTDADVLAVTRMKKQVDHEAHRMHAFVRFRKVAGDPDQYVAWYRPDYPLLRREANFFVERFRTMHWSILTPEESVYWDTQNFRFGAGVPSDPIHDDAFEEFWRTYYSNIFNPARVNLQLTKSHLPVRHWATLPESQTIHALVTEASQRTTQMLDVRPTSAADFLPDIRTLETLRAAAEKCQGCPIHRHAKNLVFGTGPANAECAMVGEQPGDNEDLTGKPFVGPAGQLFDRALAEAGSEINACRPWIVEELKIVKPRVLVLLGASAAQSILGEKITLRDRRGYFFETPFAPKTIVSAHPAGILRTQDPAQREAAYRTFVKELALVTRELGLAPAA